jgi:hypothetical protein
MRQGFNAWQSGLSTGPAVVVKPYEAAGVDRALTRRWMSSPGQSGLGGDGNGEVRDGCQTVSTYRFEIQRTRTNS